MNAEPLVVANCSKWYGHVLGVSDITWRISGGIVGVLGANGAGKTTLMKLMTGLIQPSRGSIDVFGTSPFRQPEVRARIGYAPDHDRTWDEMTVRELVTRLAELAGVDRRRAGAAASAAIELVGLADARDRTVRVLSKGMRQRTKLATAIAHDPDLIVLDEPLTGVDPVARIDLVERIRELAKRGKAICISSHVLYEIEALTDRVAVLDRGRLVADGVVSSIRRQLPQQPYRVRVVCDRPRDLAAALVASTAIASVAIDREAVVADTYEVDRCYTAVAEAVRACDLVVTGMSTLGSDLGALLTALTRGPRE